MNFTLEILFILNTKITSLLIAISLLFILFTPVAAQEPTPTPSAVEGPIYIIQSGDSLSGIAARFNISLDELLKANNILDPNAISAGDQLIIPGLEGVQGILATEIIGYGETLKNISRRNGVASSFLFKLNHITSPSEMYAGVSVIVPQTDSSLLAIKRTTITQGQSGLELAIQNNTTPWGIALQNQMTETWAFLPEDILYVLGNSSDEGQASGLPTALQKVTVSPLPATQGRTTKIIVETVPGATITGVLVDHPLAFFHDENNQWVALQGIHALLEPGPYPLKLHVTLPDGTQQSFEQMILIQSGFYPDDPLLLVEPETIDPKITEPELNQILAIVSQNSSEKLWKGIFQSPSYFNDCFTSRFGNRRTYLGSGTEQKYFSFHTGLDFCGGVDLPITAPAAGKVVFAGPLTIRGNATIIDHGWGIFSGYWHQSKIEVQVGQTVSTGDLIGYVGGTGRVTGAHLHWEIWANGIQVNPIEWLENTYP